jgi:hypothetical protein
MKFERFSTVAAQAAAICALTARLEPGPFKTVERIKDCWIKVSVRLQK